MIPLLRSLRTPLWPRAANVEYMQLRGCSDAAGIQLENQRLIQHDLSADGPVPALGAEYVYD